MDKMKTYQEIKTRHKVSSSFSFFGFIKASYEHEKTTIEGFVHEVETTLTTDASVDVDLFAEGPCLACVVTAYAYMGVLDINGKMVFSTGDPTQDTGAVDSSGNNLSERENNSDIFVL